MHALHKHSQDLKIVVLSGTFIHKPENGPEVRLGPGSYLMQAGGTNHVSGCAAGAECTFFMTSADKFDMIFAQAAAK
jgi:quercetin dioxygenase-like cupin family protein